MVELSIATYQKIIVVVSLIIWVLYFKNGIVTGFPESMFIGFIAFFMLLTYRCNKDRKFSNWKSMAKYSGIIGATFGVAILITFIGGKIPHPVVSNVMKSPLTAIGTGIAVALIAYPIIVNKDVCEN